MNKLKLGLAALAMSVPLAATAVDTTYRIVDLDARQGFDRVTINGPVGNLQVVNMPNFTSNGCSGEEPSLDTTEMARDMKDRIGGSSAKYGELASRYAPSSTCGDGSDDINRYWILKTGSGAMSAEEVTLKVTLDSALSQGNIRMELYLHGDFVAQYNCSVGQSGNNCEFTDGKTATITLKDATYNFDEVQFSGDSGDFNTAGYFRDVINVDVIIDGKATNIGYDQSAS